jgi:hypothetical protein
MRLRRAVITVVSATALTLTGLAPAGGATDRVRCGDTVTTDVALTRDLRCTGTGLYVSPGVTVDLRGHTLRGDGTGPAMWVDMDQGDGTVTLKNGVVRDWTMVLEDYARLPDLRLDRLRVLDSGVVTAGFRGDLVITRSSFLRTSGAGLGRGHVSITSSTFRDADDGFNGDDVHVDRSTFVDVDGYALSCIEGFLTVTRSRFVGNGTAIEPTWCYGALISSNVFKDNDHGIHSWMIGLYEGRDEISRNVFVDNRVAARIDVASDLTGNLFLRNDVAVRSAMAETGYAEFGSFTFDRNVLRRNGDAIWVDSPATFRRNVVVNSSGVGVYAPQGVDLGRNVIRRNGEPTCLGCGLDS